MVTATKQHMVRVSERTHTTLQELSEIHGESMTALVDRAVEEFRREDLLKRANEAWAAIIADPVSRAEIEAEDALLEATLMDGLENEEW